MEKIISTLFYNGQFWVALIEKYDEKGNLFVGKYTFGPEPNHSDMLDFYLYKAHKIRLLKSAQKVRIKKQHSKKEEQRNLYKSFEAFQLEQKHYLQQKQKSKKLHQQEQEKADYAKKEAKKKKKKRGH